jgi:hypothetical protein
MRHNLHAHGLETKFPHLDLQAFGLAAVAAELNLRIDTLEPEVAQAVERGAVALFMAGYGPAIVSTRRTHQIDKGDCRPKAGSVETVSRGRRPTRTKLSFSRKNAN